MNPRPEQRGMAASEVTLGAVTLAGGFPLEVLHDGEDGTVTLWEPQSAQAFVLDDDEAGKLAELLGRAAMPGQPPAASAPSSRCTWWSDPSDDFYGMCVKEAWHDREGHEDERVHENEHGIRWAGQRWEPGR